MKRVSSLFILISFFIFKNQIAFAVSVTLNNNWQFRNINEEKWYSATVPGTVHTDLFTNNLIPDPFYGDNENKLQWVSKQQWEYKTTFDFKYDLDESSKVFLQFDGLDTYAAVYLNDKFVLLANNMFRTYRIDVSKFLRQKNNTLRVIFRSTEKIAQNMSETLNVYPCENNRNLVRKAQYHFGWDWAPRYVTCGIWRNVKLVFDEAEESTWPQYLNVRLIQEEDSIGQSFYFTVDGKPAFMKGANWIPADVFCPTLQKINTGVYSLQQKKQI